MPDLQRTAARLLRAALVTGAALVATGVLLTTAGLPSPGNAVGGVGIGIVVFAPFATLIGIAAVGRRTSTAAYAVASVVLAVAGLLLA